MKFYVCNHCGNIIAYVKSSGVPVVCCGDVMKELVPNTTDAAVEKHVPVIHTDGQKVTVTVGSAKHPMLEEHYIEWIDKAWQPEKRTETGPEASGRVYDQRGRRGLRSICILQSSWIVEGIRNYNEYSTAPEASNFGRCFLLHFLRIAAILWLSFG